VPAHQHEPNDFNAHQRHHPLAAHAKNNIKTRASLFHFVLESTVQSTAQPIDYKQSQTPRIPEEQFNDRPLLFGQRRGYDSAEHL
jgi:hypothetical protein